MGRFTTEAKVGIFVLAGLIILAYMSFRIGKFELGREAGHPISALFRTASGLQAGVPVEIAGIEVGRVQKIALEEGQARVTMLIRPDIVLGVDSLALIRTKGVLGDKYVEIIPGAKGAPRLEPGGQLVQTRAPADVDQLITQISEISSDIKRVTRSLNEVLGGAEGTASMRTILNNMREMSETLTTLVRENNEHLNRMIKDLASFSQDLKSISSTNKDNIRVILASFRDASEKIDHTMTALKDIAEKVNRGEGSLGELVNDSTTIDNLNQTLASLNEISDKINRGEGTIGRLIHDETTAERINEALGGVNEYLTRTEAFKFFVDYRGEWMMDTEDLKSTLNLRIQPKKDKYYLLGIVADPRGRYRRSEKAYTTASGARITTTEETWDKGELKFNAQIAKRYRNLTLRGGLIESGGGFGLDYYLLHDDLKLYFEAFAPEPERNPNLRLGLTYDFWKYFYVSAGYDDLISDQSRESAFFGLGLKFRDEDLKYLLTDAPLPTGR